MVLYRIRRNLSIIGQQIRKRVDLGLCVFTQKIGQRVVVTSVRSLRCITRKIGEEVIQTCEVGRVSLRLGFGALSHEVGERIHIRLRFIAQQIAQRVLGPR